MTKNKIEYPRIASRDEWLVARKELLAREKEATRARGALNAERRRLPMVEIEKNDVYKTFEQAPAGGARPEHLPARWRNCLPHLLDLHVMGLPPR